MSYIEGVFRNQGMLFPDTVDEYIDEDNPVRFIDVFIDSLDLKALGFTHAEVEPTGRPPYNPADLLKLYIYGYLNRVRTSRRLEAETRRNVEVMWLLKKLTPDFKTISDFRKDNRKAIKRVFKEFILLCKRLNLFSGELVAIDGCKIKAVNSKKRNFNKKKLRRSIDYLERKIDEYIEELDKNDAKESKNKPINSSKNLKEKINIFKDRKEKYLSLLKDLEESGEEQISLTDPESRLMVNDRSADVCYNVQIATDNKHKLILDYEVTNEGIDFKHLSGMSKLAKETLGLEKIEVTADKGYYDSLEIKKSVDQGIIPYIPERESTVSKKIDIPRPEFYKNKFIYDAEKDIYVCPCGEELSFKRKAIINGRVMKLYKSSSCFNCLSKGKCTRNPRGKIIYRWIHEEILEEMKERIRKEKWKVKIRQLLIEHVFGTIKRNFEQGYFLTKGKENVSGEMGLTALAYDIKRVLNIIGVKRLIAVVKAMEKGKENIAEGIISIFRFILKKLGILSFSLLKIKYKRITYA